MAGIVQIQLPGSARNSMTESANEIDESFGSGSNSSSNSNSAYVSSTASASPTHGLAPPLWTHRVSASFSAMAEQIVAASKAIAMIPPLPDAVYSALSERLEAIERAQEGLGEDLRDVKERLAKLEMGVSRANGNGITTDGEKSAEDKEGEVNASNVTQESFEKLEKMLKEQSDFLKLEQQRLPPRLHNAIVTVSKMGIKPLIATNGKPPMNFPTTRGEFEHLTKERYETLLKAYGQPVPKEINGRRDALRSFIGLPE